MKTKRPLIAVLLLLAVAGGFKWQADATKRFLKNSDKFVLYSLDPVGIDLRNPRPERFHNVTVLGKVSITKADEKGALVDALFNSVVRCCEAECHDPRHGLHVERSGHAVDLTICFECQNVYVYQNGDRVQKLVITRSAQDVFNKILSQHHLPLAKK